MPTQNIQPTNQKPTGNLYMNSTGQTYANEAVYKSGAPATGGNITNPISSGNMYRNDINATGQDINNRITTNGLNQSPDYTKLNDNLKQQTDFLQKRADQLQADYEANIGGIKTAYDEALGAQRERQDKDYAGTSNKLVTSGGGFLGYTGSQGGVLQNLKHTFEGEKTALLAKRDAALLAAREAHNEKQFAYAKEQLDLAKNAEKEIYDRQKDYADQSLAIARENRAQAEYDRGYTDERLKAYSALSADEFAKLPAEKIAEVDKFYYPGYTEQARNINQKIAEGKSLESDIKLKTDIQELINKTPYGQRIILADGTSLVGVKTSSGGNSIKDPIPSSIANQLGVPNISGQSQRDIILSLALPNAPLWYKQLYQSQNPTGYAAIKNNPAAIDADWDTFRNLPTFTPFKNTVDITKTTTNLKPGTSSSDNPFVVK